MSIRQFTPRRRRRGISQRARYALGGSLGLTILLQMSYPLVNGDVLAFITISSVMMGALAMAFHAYLSYGPKYATRYLILILLFGYFIEFLGLHTGWPFGEYVYDDSLGLNLGGVPLVVPFAWAMMAHPVLVAARKVTIKWTFLYGGALMASWISSLILRWLQQDVGLGLLMAHTFHSRQRFHSQICLGGSYLVAQSLLS